MKIGDKVKLNRYIMVDGITISKDTIGQIIEIYDDDEEKFVIYFDEYKTGAFLLKKGEIDFNVD
jgi:hypothetical protein